MQINALIYNDKIKIKKNEYRGLDYLIIKEPQRKRTIKKNIFISFGGYDHRNLMKKTMKAVEKIILENKYKIEVNLISDKYVSNNKNIKVHDRPENFYELMAKSEIIICSGGLTVFEAASLNKKILAIPQYHHQLKNLQRLSKKADIKLVSDKSMRISEYKIEKLINELISTNLEIKNKINIRQSSNNCINILKKIINE